MTWYTRRPLSVQSSGLLLAPLLCYFATAVLVLLPRTLPIRLAILPITLFYAFRASTQLDLAACFREDGRLAYANQELVMAMIVLAIRAILWTFPQKPYRRIHKSSDVPLTYRQTLLDAADLCYNLRGIGWSWSRLPDFPTEARSSFTFFRHTLVSFAFHLVLSDVTFRLAQLLGTNAMSSPLGGSIFDPSLSPIHRYSRSTLITFFVVFMFYASLSAAYLLISLFSLMFLSHSPSQWPPLFDRPWLSTSLSQFWSRRWHQLFREIFVSFGGKPLARLMGPVGSVLGAFFVSGIMHSFGVWAMGQGGEFVKVTGFFMIMPVGILLERSWKDLTGSRVDGFFGRVWTYVWLLGWGNIIIDAWSTKGLMGSAFFPEGYRPSDYIFQWWIKS